MTVPATRFQVPRVGQTRAGRVHAASVGAPVQGFVASFRVLRARREAVARPVDAISHVVACVANHRSRAQVFNVQVQVVCQPIVVYGGFRRVLVQCAVPFGRKIRAVSRGKARYEAARRGAGIRFFVVGNAARAVLRA